MYAAAVPIFSSLVIPKYIACRSSKFQQISVRNIFRFFLCRSNLQYNILNLYEYLQIELYLKNNNLMYRICIRKVNFQFSTKYVHQLTIIINSRRLYYTAFVQYVIYTARLGGFQDLITITFILKIKG